MIFLISFLSELLLAAAPSDLNPPDLQEMIQKGLEYAYIDQYDSTEVFFHKALDAYPDNPAGYFFNAALLQLRMMDACHYDHEEEYFFLLNTAIAKAESILAIKEDAWAQFYLGSSYTYWAVFEGLRKDYLETFTYGVKGGKILQEITSKDPTFYDAFLGAGTYEYFWARAARYLPMLNLGGGNVVQAINKIKVAADSSLYSGPTAFNTLAFIYGEEKDYALAMEIIDTLLTLYPRSRTFLWTKADLEMDQEHYDVAAVIYLQLHDIYARLDEPNYANCAQCKLLEGTCYYKMKHKEAAREALKMVIQYKTHAERFPVIKEYSREAYGLLARIY
jgi:tetratricopeptide (TPR) repeat protein